MSAVYVARQAESGRTKNCMVSVSQIRYLKVNFAMGIYFGGGQLYSIGSPKLFPCFEF